MSHQYVVAALCLTLAGCGIIPTRFDEKPQQTAAARDGSCVATATARANDAAYNGYDSEMQKRIYDYTYVDCMKFQRQHGH